VTEPARKGLAIGMFLMFLNQFSGILAIITYTTVIFKNSGSQWSANESAITIALIQLVGVYVSMFCVDRYGRKILLSFSCAGASMSLCVLATYSYLSENGTSVDNYNYIPILSLSMAVLSISCGIASLPYIIFTEVMPPKVSSVDQ